MLVSYTTANNKNSALVKVNTPIYTVIWNVIVWFLLLKSVEVMYGYGQPTDG